MMDMTVHGKDGRRCVNLIIWIRALLEEFKRVCDKNMFCGGHEAVSRKLALGRHIKGLC